MWRLICGDKYVETNMWRQICGDKRIVEVQMCSRLDDSEELMEEGRLAGLDGTIMQVLDMITMPMMVIEVSVEILSYDQLQLNSFTL